MSDDGRDGRPRTPSPTAFHYRIEAIRDRIDVCESSIKEARQAIERCELEHRATTNNLRSEVSTLADTTREIGTVKRAATWVLAIVIPLLLIGGVSVIQSMTQQQELEKDANVAAEKTIQVESRIQTIEVDVAAIKQEQRSTRQTLEKVSEKLDDMRDSQARVEDTIRRRR